MNLYDREYFREEQKRYSPQNPLQPGPGGYSVVTILIAINVIIFLVDQLTIVRLPNGGSYYWLSEFLAMKTNVFANAFAQPWEGWNWVRNSVLLVWDARQFVTYGFAHNPMSLMHVGFNMYGLWLFGRDVERTYGKIEFLLLYLFLIVVSGLVWLLVQIFIVRDAGGLIGASGAVVGMTILFALNFPNRKFTLLFLPTKPIPAWVLAVAYIAFDLFGVLFDQNGTTAYIGHLAGAAFAYLYFRWHIRFTSFLSINKISSGGKGIFGFGGRSSRLKLHDPEAAERKLDEEGDRILAKLNREGMDSLTRREKKVLEDYSRSVRQRRK